ncbi:tetratricopeptide repeat protein [Pseudomonas sp. MBLB4123]|uniref:tetratricopeptide repeat protein n=1 Tax=Pseudomonas sp. MBLB4123 TaxID=3451557 RepID=UPI003F74F8FE
MDKTLCRYHPAQPATWQCPPCQRAYGDCCIPLNADAPDETPTCPLCAGRLQFLGAANTAQPFWERIPAFFVYALQGGPLAFAALLALASLFMPRWIVLWILLFSVATKYFHSVIEASSQADRQAPSLASAFGGEGFSLFCKQLAVFLIAFAVLWLAADFDSEALYWAVNIGLLLALPASIIRLALDKELGAALSPEQIGQVMGAMGWRYLILCVFLFILWQSPSWVTYMLSSGLPRVVLMPVAAFLFGYFGVVMCAMMGYAVFQYQGALGYVIADENASAAYPAPEYLRRRALAEAEVRLKEGQSGQALETLAKALERDANDLKLNERFHQLLFGLNARERCLRHLAHYLPLAARLNPALAATAVLNARQLGADYLPDDALVCERVAEALLQRHKTREGLSLLRNLHQRFPDYPHIPRAYLLASRGFAEGLGQLGPAQKLLAFIRTRYPQSPLLGEVAALEATLGKLTEPS